MEGTFDTVEEALSEIRAGKMVIVVDDEGRENEGDLVLAAERATPEAVNFMITHARGLVCVPTEPAILDRLGLRDMTPEEGHPGYEGCRFTVSIDAKRGVGSGISAADRAATVRALFDPASTAADFKRPGHTFPLRAREGGVLTRRGHTEAAVDLARLAGLAPAGVICEIIKDDGTMARLPDLVAFKVRFGLKLIQIEDLAAHRRRTEQGAKAAQAMAPAMAPPGAPRAKARRVAQAEPLILGSQRIPSLDIAARPPCSWRSGRKPENLE